MNKWMMTSAIGMCLLISLVVAARLVHASDQRDRVETAEVPILYSTWKGHLSDADTCATAWLIKRFVSTNARFKFYEQGIIEMEGIPFSVPQAELSVRSNKTVFELVIEKNSLDDEALLLLARVVRDIEMNKWGDRATDEAAGLEALLRGAERIADGNDDKLLDTGLVLFDCLYADIKHKLRN